MMNHYLECDEGKVVFSVWIDREVTVREYDLLRCSPEAFDWLCKELARRFENTKGERGSVPLDYLRIEGGELDGVVIETHIGGPVFSTPASREHLSNMIKPCIFAEAATWCTEGELLEKAIFLRKCFTTKPVEDWVQFLHDLRAFMKEECSKSK